MGEAKSQRWWDMLWYMFGVYIIVVYVWRVLVAPVVLKKNLDHERWRVCRHQGPVMKMGVYGGKTTTGRRDGVAGGTVEPLGKLGSQRPAADRPDVVQGGGTRACWGQKSTFRGIPGSFSGAGRGPGFSSISPESRMDGGVGMENLWASGDLDCSLEDCLDQGFWWTVVQRNWKMYGQENLEKRNGLGVVERWVMGLEKNLGRAFVVEKRWAMGLAKKLGKAFVVEKGWGAVQKKWQRHWKWKLDGQWTGQK